MVTGESVVLFTFEFAYTSCELCPVIFHEDTEAAQVAQLP